MYSLNQVDKLVSCGRDPARSLPLWRGFLLIPLILVCFAFAPNAQTAPETPDPPPIPGAFNTGDGTNALRTNITGAGNSAFGFDSIAQNIRGSFNTGAGAFTLLFNRADENTGVGAAALLFNVDGTRNTACGAGAMVNTVGDVDLNGSSNDAVGAFALNANTTGFSNNAVGDSAMFRNLTGAQNTAVGDEALLNNDATASGASFNTAVGASAMFFNTTGSSNTVVGAGAGPNLAAGFNNTYVGQFVGDNNGTPIADEDLTIRIADVSVDGFGSAACFIGGIFNKPQPVGGNVVAVTLNLDTDQLGVDMTMGRPGAAPAPHRSAPQPRMRPEARHQAMLNDKVEKLQTTVTQQQATVAQQQKQIEALTTQLREQAAQIQKVSAQLEMVRPTPRLVENR